MPYRPREADPITILLKALANGQRLKIAATLQDKEKDWSGIAQHIALSQSALTQQLAVLHRAGVLRKRREGLIVHYSIPDPRIRTIIALAADVAAEKAA